MADSNDKADIPSKEQVAMQQKSPEQIHQFNKEILQPQSNGDHEMVAQQQRLSIFLIIIGFVLMIGSLVFKAFATVATVLATFGSTTLSIGLITLYFERWARQTWLRHVGMKLQSITSNVLDYKVVGRFDELVERVKAVGEFDLKLRD